jgi:hypothetical protein
MFAGIKAEYLSICQWLVEKYDVDPFQEETVEEEDDDEDDDDENDSENENETNQQNAPVSPFLSAARKTNKNPFQFFLHVWDERFASSGGKNSDGDCGLLRSIRISGMHYILGPSPPRRLGNDGW